MYDQSNPTIIIFSPKLENALNMKALHVKQIIETLLPAEDLSSNPKQQIARASQNQIQKI